MCYQGGRLVIPKPLQYRAIGNSVVPPLLAISWSSRLKENLKQAMYWTNMRSSVGQFVKQCKSCQVNNRSKHSYGKLPPKLVLKIPWEALCVDPIGPHTIKGKDGSVIDFMLGLTDRSCFELV